MMFKACLWSVLLMNAQAATFTVHEIRETFQRYDVYPLNKRNLHEDTKNAELVHLGNLLFFDKILSGNKDIACATCHFPTKGTSDNLPISIGTGGEGLAEERRLSAGHFIPRNAPAAFNMGYDSFHTTMWDGRISVERNLYGAMALNTPEPAINGFYPEETTITEQITSIAAAQALFPVTSFHEMRGLEGENEIADAPGNLEVWRRLTKRLMNNERYVALFKDAFTSVKSKSDVHFGHVARAIGAFEMANFRADQTDFDDFLKGDNRALTRAQVRGASLFVGKGQCISCHNGPHLTNFQPYSSGMPQLGPGKELIADGIGEDLGMMLITDDGDDRYQFKTPTLRNTFHTGPWSHAGAYNDLKSFLFHHANPEQGMINFLSTPHRYVSNDMFIDLIDFDPIRNSERVDSVDTLLTNISLNKNEIDDLYEFLRSLSDLSLYDLVDIPDHVPSGLPVD